MKTLSLALLAAALPFSLHANPEVRAAVAQAFGEAQASKIILVQATPNAADPQQWTVYAADAFRPKDQVRSIVTLTAALGKRTPPVLAACSIARRRLRSISIVSRCGPAPPAMLWPRPPLLRTPVLPPWPTSWR